MPSILLPSRTMQQPQQAAVIDWNNPLARGLVFAALPGGPDLVSGTQPVKFGAASTGVNEQGRTLYTPGVTSDGWYWPLPANHPLYGITSQDTIFVLAKRVTGSSFNNLLGVPYKSGAWANPYYAWGLSGQSDNTMGAYTFAVNSSTRNSTTSASGLFTNNVTQAVGATRSGTRVRFYNGSLQFGGDQAITAGSPDWTNKQPLVLFNRSNTSPGEGMQAHAGLVLVWNRELSPEEWAALAQNPLQLVKASPRRLWTASTGTPGSTSGTFAASEAGDTLAASGSVAFNAITGTAASTEGADTLAASGSAAFGAISGTASSTEPADSIAASGNASFASISGTSGVTEAGDTATGSGSTTFPALSGTMASTEPGDTAAITGAALSAIDGSMAATEDSDTLAAGTAQPAAPSGGGAGSVREVRAFADLLNQTHKPTRSQKKARRKQLEAEALELLPDLPEAEKLAPIAARIVYEKEAQAMAPLYANRPVDALQPVVIPFDAHEALRELLDKLLAEALLQQKVAEDEENDIELLLFGT